jgi:hypothetical protein
MVKGMRGMVVCPFLQTRVALILAARQGGLITRTARLAMLLRTRFSRLIQWHTEMRRLVTKR